MAGHLYNLLYTNPLAIFCQINMTIASCLILPPYHTTAIPPTLQHGVVMPPIYCMPHACHCFILYATYALQVLPHAWVLLSLYTVCYALRVLPHVWVLLPVYTVCSVYYAVWVMPHVWDYIMLAVLHNMYSKKICCALSVLHTCYMAMS